MSHKTDLRSEVSPKVFQIEHIERCLFQLRSGEEKPSLRARARLRTSSHLSSAPSCVSSTSPFRCGQLVSLLSTTATRHRYHRWLVSDFYFPHSMAVHRFPSSSSYFSSCRQSRLLATSGNLGFVSSLPTMSVCARARSRLCDMCLPLSSLSKEMEEKTNRLHLEKGVGGQRGGAKHTGFR